MNSSPGKEEQIVWGNAAQLADSVHILLSELVDSDDGKPGRRNTREWIKRREGAMGRVLHGRRRLRGYFTPNQRLLLFVSSLFKNWSWLSTVKTKNWQYFFSSKPKHSISKLLYHLFEFSWQKHSIRGVLNLDLERHDSIQFLTTSYVGWNVTKRIQHYPTSKSREKKGWKLDEMFDSDQTLIQHFFPSSNIIFSSFSIFALEQTIPTFHPTKRKWHVGWNVGIVYLGL